MKFKTGLIIFLIGCLTGSGVTWFWLQEPEIRDKWIEAAQEKIDQVISTEEPATNSVPSGMASLHAYGGLPVDLEYPGNLMILKNTGFVVGYCEERNNPAWVSYRIFALPNLESRKRPSRFKMDPRTDSQIDHNDYTQSGYDRGHMAPNYAISTRYGPEAQLETFLMSNIVPQSPELNQGPWRELEEIISGYAQEDEEVWVITGPLYDNQPEYIGPQIEVPDAFYKIVLDETPAGLRVLCFDFPQDVGRKDDPTRYLTTVDAIEELSGLDFLSGLPDDLEEQLEASQASRLW